MNSVDTFLVESNAIEGVYDVYSFEQAQHAWDYLMSEKELTLGVVLKTHKILMLNKPLFPNEIGYLRQVDVYVGGRKCLRWDILEGAVRQWCEEMNAICPIRDFGTKENISKRLHIDYEKIHPFVDGNGRTGRMFMNWWRIKNNLPLLIIREGEQQMEYYKWFKETL